MAYFKIGNTDYSPYVCGLSINRKARYSSETNAMGNTVVDYVNAKRIIKVTIIPLGIDIMANLQTALEAFNVNISFRNPKTNLLEENVNCIVSDINTEYYTIQDSKVMYKKMTLTFTEL